MSGGHERYQRHSQTRVGGDMTDLELTELVAVKCGLKTTSDKYGIYIEGNYPSISLVHFDPLHSFDDLFTYIVPRMEEWQLFRMAEMIKNREIGNLLRSACETFLEV